MAMNEGENKKSGPYNLSQRRYESTIILRPIIKKGRKGRTVRHFFGKKIYQPLVVEPLR